MNYDPFRTAPTRFVRQLQQPNPIEGPPLRRRFSGWWLLILFVALLFVWGMR